VRFESDLVTTPLPADQTSRIVFLDWLRIAAFVSVLGWHKFSAPLTWLATSADIHASLRELALLILPFFQLGGAGVVVFFLVSGYIITHVLLRETSLTFLVRRFFRIYPLYVIAVLIQTVGAVWVHGAKVDFLAMLGCLSLCGDFFHLPYTLGGVEWTLRVEVLFYVFMAVLKFCGIVDGRHARWLPVVLAACTVALLVMPPSPGPWTWCIAYYNLFAPFLLLGVFFYLQENARIGARSLIAMTALVLLGVWILTPVWQPNLAAHHFVAYGFGIFFLFWSMRQHLSLPAPIALLSELTYAIYLFHNWIYDYLLIISQATFDSEVAANLVALFLLFSGCWIATRFFERPAVRLGTKLSRRFQRQVPAE
jgi:peptidoglycan/LPS O-acetylase OafA/YrhL